MHKTFRCAIEKFMEMPKAARLFLIMIPVVILLLLLALPTPFFGGSLFSYDQVYRKGNLVVEAVGDKDGIVMLKINDGSPVIDTRASVYQRFSVIIVAPDQLLFLSSDIGDSLFRKSPHGIWARESLLGDISPDREFAVMVADHNNGNPLSDSNADFSALSDRRGVFADIGESTDLSESWANWIIVSLPRLNSISSAKENPDFPPHAVFVIRRKGEKLCYRNEAMRFAFPVNHGAKFVEWTVEDGMAVAVTILSNPPQTVNLY